jgi:hypothetical protein
MISATVFEGNKNFNHQFRHTGEQPFRIDVVPSVLRQESHVRDSIYVPRQRAERKFIFNDAAFAGGLFEHAAKLRLCSRMFIDRRCHRDQFSVAKLVTA